VELWGICKKLTKRILMVLTYSQFGTTKPTSYGNGKTDLPSRFLIQNLFDWNLICSYGGLTFAFRGAFMPLATSVFRVEEAEVNELILAFLFNVRLVLLFFILAPAIALHWTIRSKE
jgi:hypothetical protein